MTSVSQEQQQDELPLDALVLQCEKERYKIGYAALRWAKEIKQKENLPEPIPALIPRALREILTKKVSLKEVEKLPMVVKIAPPPPPTVTASPPTIKMNPSAEEEKPAAPTIELKTEEAPAEQPEAPKEEAPAAPEATEENKEETK